MVKGNRIIGYSSLIVLTGLGIHYGVQHVLPTLIKSYSSLVSTASQSLKVSTTAPSSNTTRVQKSTLTGASQSTGETVTPSYVTTPQGQTAPRWSRRVNEQPVSSWQPLPSGSLSGGSGTNESLPQNTQPSSNWAGYIDSPKQSQIYTSVSGDWTVPNVSAAYSQLGAAAQWIGLGGVSNSNLLQVGTIEHTVNGQVVATVFWEKLPSTAQEVMQIPVGSHVTAQIKHTSGSHWNVQFSAVTPQGKHLVKTISVTLTQSYEKGIGTSAEWISEDPSDASNNLYPLADTGTVQFSKATVNGVALGNTENQVYPVAMIGSSGGVLISPSVISADKRTFSTTTNSSALVSSSRVTRRGRATVQYGRGRGYGISESPGRRNEPWG